MKRLFIFVAISVACLTSLAKTSATCGSKLQYCVFDMRNQGAFLGELIGVGYSRNEVYRSVLNLCKINFWFDDGCFIAGIHSANPPRGLYLTHCSDGSSNLVNPQ